MSDKITWYGHAALLLEISGKQVLIDPFLDGNPAACITADEADAEFILVTHGHEDHLGDTIPIAQRTGALVISNFEISEWLRGKGLRTHGQSIGGGFRHPFGYLKLTQALHSSSLPDGSHGGSPSGFLVTTLSGHKIYLAGDTGLFYDMRLIGEEGIDLAVLPIGDNYTMGPDDAFRAVRLLNPSYVLPIHYGTWDLIRQDVGAWVNQVEDETSTRVVALQPCQSFTLPE
jgi:L-ascorbate metabolism protein UlaG (beta-lactamase superfamily)